MLPNAQHPPFIYSTPILQSRYRLLPPRVRLLLREPARLLLRPVLARPRPLVVRALLERRRLPLDFRLRPAADFRPAREREDFGRPARQREDFERHAAAPP